MFVCFMCLLKLDLILKGVASDGVLLLRQKGKISFLGISKQRAVYSKVNINLIKSHNNSTERYNRELTWSHEDRVCD